jgi:hypothetical protein
MDLMHDYAGKPVFIEYLPFSEEGLAPGTVSIH